MFILAAIGWVDIAAGGLAAFAGFSMSEPFWIVMGLSCMISGVLFLALDRGLSLLTEIRDKLVGETQDQARAPAKRTPFDDALLDGE